MSSRLLFTAVIAVGVALAILGASLFGLDSQTARADDADGVIIGLDMIPDGSNTATALGTIDRCRNASPGDVIDIDVFIDDLEVGPLGPGGLTNDECVAGIGWKYAGWPASGTDGTTPEVSSHNHALFLAAVGAFSPLSFDEGLPDGDDPFAEDVADFGGGQECASTPLSQGVLVRYTHDLTGASPGLYSLEVYDSTLGPGNPPVIARGGGGSGDVTVAATWDSNYTDSGGTYGLLAVSPTVCPLGADVKKQSLTAIGPGGWQGVESTDIPFTLRAVLHNNGSDSPVNVEDVTTIVVPAGVQISYHTTDQETVDINGTPSTPGPGNWFYANPGDTVTVTYPLSLTQSVQVIHDEDWDFHCLDAVSIPAPTLVFDDTVNVLPISFETTPGNNSQHLEIVLDCQEAASGNVKIVSQSVLSAPAVKAPLDAMLPFLDGTIVVQEDPNDIVIRKVIHNNGPWLTVPTDVTKTISLSYLGMNAVTYPNACVITPATPPTVQVNLTESMAVNHDETFNIVCDRGGLSRDDDLDGENDEDRIGGFGVDNDGDSSVDEDSCGTNTAGPGSAGDYGAGFDDDGDTQIDEDDFGGDDDCDGTTDEDSPFYIVQITVDNLLETKGGVVDPDTGDNTATTVVSLAVIRPFTPTLVSNFDDDQPAVQVDPVADECLAGLPCKMMNQIDIAGPPPATSFAGDQPFPEAMNIVIGTMPGEWTHASGLDLKAVIGTYGIPVGNFDFSVGTDFGFLNDCAPPFGTFLAGTDVTLSNACLPPNTDGSSPMLHALVGGRSKVDATCDVDQDNYGGFLDGIGLGGFYQAMLPGAATDLLPAWGTGTDPFSGFVSWSSHLDHTTNKVLHKFDGTGNPPLVAYLWARYNGVVWVDKPGTPNDPTDDTPVPINLLVFDMAGGTGQGPWMLVTVISDPDPGGGIPGMDLCTPFMVNIMTLGKTSTNVDILTCNGGAFPTSKTLSANFVRPMGETDSVYDFDGQCIAENDIECLLVKDESPNLDIGIPDSENVLVTITNGVVPDDVDVEVSIVSPIACSADWDAAYSGTVNSFDVGANHFSIINFSSDAVAPGGQMTGSESRVATLTYTATCAAGTHDLQIISNLSSATPLPDPDTLNNQCENHVVATANDDDADNDTVLNPVDNCPHTPNPDQADNDGDGLGDACDDDDDNDGILDVDDDCPFTAEDLDGEDDGDGCPDSDAHSIIVDKNDPYDVDVSVDHRETVTTTITNGNYGLYAPDSMWFIELLKSDVTNPDDNCQARWVVEPGDGYVEDVIWADLDGDTVNDTLELWSQLEVYIPNVPPYNDVTKTRDYIVHCNARSTHTIFLEEAAVPAWPVVDPNVQNGNVHKQYITVNAWDNADVKIISADVHSAPTSLDASVTDYVIVKKVLHNNGPSAVTAAEVYLSSSSTAPNDCTVALEQYEDDLGQPLANAYDLPVSINVAVFERWSIHCTDPSDHTFEFNNDLVIDAVHLRDPDDTNNSSSTSIDLPVLAYADTQAVDVFVEGLPADINASENVPVVLKAIVQNNGPYTTVNVQVDISATAPPDCTLVPSSGSEQTVVHNGTPVAVTVAAVLHCTEASAHIIDTSATVSAPKDPHVSDPDAQNQSAGNSQGFNVWANADIKITDLSAPSVVLVQSSVPEVITVSETLHNNGPYGPVDVSTQLDVVIGSCAGLADVVPGGIAGAATLAVSVSSSDSNDLTVHWTDLKQPDECTFTIAKSVDLDAAHVIDQDGASASIDVTLCVDTDDDGVPDDCLGEVDNCPSTANPDQTDSDGDGLGDACDDQPTHRVVVKGCFKLGPAPANLSDYQGRYMWAVCEIGNLEPYVEGVTISMAVTDPPAGCSEDEQLVLPGQSTFLMSGQEQKWILYRTRYECHDPAQPGVNALTVDICTDPQPQPYDDDGDTDVDEDDIDGIDNDADSLVDEDPPEGDGPPDCHQQIKQLIVHQP